MAEGQSRPQSRLWAVVRFALGMAQMAGATVAVVLLVSTGVTAASLFAAIVTCVFTSVSVLLFGAPRHASHDGSSRSRT